MSKILDAITAEFDIAPGQPAKDLPIYRVLGILGFN